MTMFVSFILVGITSIILYIVPHGRVAYWADWHLLGLTKTEWGNLHINVLTFGESIKDAASEKYGEPPYGHAELSSLKLFSKKQNLDLEQAMELLKKSDIQFTDSQQTIGVIAKLNKVSPQAIYEIIKPATKIKKEGEKVMFPETPMSGFGKKTLGALCSEYDLMYQAVRQALAKKGVTADAEMTIKEIAAANDTNPMELFEYLHEIATEMQKM
jgi:hypothetical protein